MVSLGRVIIAGSRTLGIDDVRVAMRHFGIMPTIVVCGCATGADRGGWDWARRFNLPVEFFPAWNAQYGWAYGVKHPGETIHQPITKQDKSAGFARNAIMADSADALVAIWDGCSMGTKHMISQATARNIKVFIWNAAKETK